LKADDAAESNIEKPPEPAPEPAPEARSLDKTAEKSFSLNVQSMAINKRPRNEFKKIQKANKKFLKKAIQRDPKLVAKYGNVYQYLVPDNPSNVRDTGRPASGIKKDN